MAADAAKEMEDAIVLPKSPQQVSFADGLPGTWFWGCGPAYGVIHNLMLWTSYSVDRSVAMPQGQCGTTMKCNLMSAHHLD